MTFWGLFAEMKEVEASSKLSAHYFSFHHSNSIFLCTLFSTNPHPALIEKFIPKAHSFFCFVFTKTLQVHCILLLLFWRLAQFWCMTCLHLIKWLLCNLLSWESNLQHLKDLQKALIIIFSHLQIITPPAVFCVLCVLSKSTTLSANNVLSVYAPLFKLLYVLIPNLSHPNACFASVWNTRGIVLQLQIYRYLKKKKKKHLPK